MDVVRGGVSWQSDGPSCGCCCLINSQREAITHLLGVKRALLSSKTLTDDAGVLEGEERDRKVSKRDRE